MAGFLFDLDQSNICRDIQKIESLIRNCLPIPQKIYKITKRLQTPDEVEKYFPGFVSFIDSTEQQIPRPTDNKRKKIILFGQEEKTYCKDTELWLTIMALSSIKQTIKKEEGMTIISIKRIILLLPKEVVNVVDLGYLG